MFSAIKNIICLFAFVLLLASCQKDEELINSGRVMAPEKMSSGTDINPDQDNDDTISFDGDDVPDEGCGEGDDGGITDDDDDEDDDDGGTITDDDDDEDDDDDDSSGKSTHD